MRVFMMIALLFVGCGPTMPTQSVKPARVAAAQLVNDYRDFPATTDKTYRNRAVQIHLPAKSYRIAPGRVETFHGLPGTPGAIVFECEPPKDTESGLLITGICRGQVHDGIERANGISWFVRVESCNVTLLIGHRP